MEGERAKGPKGLFAVYGDRVHPTDAVLLALGARLLSAPDRSLLGSELPQYRAEVAAAVDLDPLEAEPCRHQS